MAINLQDNLNRLKSKTVVLLEKYNALSDEKNKVDTLNANLQSENEKLRIELEKAKRDIEYLQIARNISTTPEDIANSKAILSQLVRDVDKCIAQLND